MKFKLLFLFFSLESIFCFHLNFAYGLCNECDSSLLLQMKQKFSFSPNYYADFQSTRLVSWNSSTDCCSWKGVTCNKSSGYVTGLDLSGESITSGIDDSSALFKLQNLTSLNLAYNLFYSPIPSAFKRLTNLVYLNLSASQFSGQIPSEILRLKRLVSLDLSYNLYSESLELKLENPDLVTLCKELPELRELILDFVSISMNGLEWSHALSSSLPNLEVLSLASCKLSGPLHPSLLKLQFLSKLVLYRNNISSQVPESICNLTRLKHLDLSHNHLFGVVPPCLLINLPLLHTLNLRHNNFSGKIGEFSKALSLVELDLSYNLFEGPIPLSIFEVSSLEVLKLSYNKLNGTLGLQMFQNLRNLLALDLSGNDLWINTGGVDSTLFPQVYGLGLSSCKLRTFPKFLSYQSQLRILDLSNNSILGKVPNWIGKIGNGSLFYLNISLNMLENLDQPLPHGSLKNLQFVDLHSNLLKGPLPILPQATSFMDFSHNFLNGEIPSSICLMEDLSILDLSHNNLSGEIPHCLSRMPLLQVMNLQKNNLHGLIPNIFQRECSLTMLILNGNSVEGKIPESLANCNNLEVLDLGNNKLIGSFPSWLGESLELRVLVLSSNMLQGIIKYRGTNNTFSKLHIVDLSSNNFTGNLPSEFFSRLKVMMTYQDKVPMEYEQQELRFIAEDHLKVYYQDVTITNKGIQMKFEKILTFFTSIDLSNNQFDGEIPQVIGNLISLHALNLSHNALIGLIPSSLGNLKQLESLDISNNKLRGGIPKELADLNFLQVLILSCNQLVGKIPEGGQFQTFPEVYFGGNNLLCGPPTSKSCTNIVKDMPLTNYSENLCRLSMFKNCQNDWKYNWLLISIALGYGIGLGISICVISFWRPWNWFCMIITRKILHMD